MWPSDQGEEPALMRGLRGEGDGGKHSQLLGDAGKQRELRRDRTAQAIDIERAVTHTTREKGPQSVGVHHRIWAKSMRVGGGDSQCVSDAGQQANLSRDCPGQ